MRHIEIYFGWDNSYYDCLMLTFDCSDKLFYDIYDGLHNDVFSW